MSEPKVQTTVRLPEDLYNRLLALRGPGESLNSVVERAARLLVEVKARALPQ